VTGVPLSGDAPRSPASVRLELEGHVIDSRLLAKVLDEILANG